MRRLLISLMLASAPVAAQAAPRMVACTTPMIGDDARLSDAGAAVYETSMSAGDPAMARIVADGRKLRARIEKAVLANRSEALIGLRAEEAEWNIARANAANAAALNVLAQLSPRDKAIYARIWRMNPDTREASSAPELANRSEAEAVRRQIVALTRCPLASDAELTRLMARELALETDYQLLHAASAGGPEQVRLAYLGKIGRPALTQVALAAKPAN